MDKILYNDVISSSVIDDAKNSHYLNDDDFDSDDNSSVGSVEPEYVNSNINCFSFYSHDLYKPIKLKEFKLKFKNYFELIKFIKDNLYIKNDYYHLKLSNKKYNLILIFRTKEKLIEYFNIKFNFEYKYQIYLKLQ